MSWIACQEWPWVSYWRGRGKEPATRMPESMRLSREAGFDGWEGSLPSGPEELTRLASSLQGAGLGLRSLYANARLHEADAPERAADLVRRCRESLPLGLSVLVLNPEPIDWNRPLEKSWAELERQQTALEGLRLDLGKFGVGLAYHIHDSEMRSDGREMLAMLQGLPSLGLCLEPEWMLRAGWAPARVLEVVRTQAPRFLSAHLRQHRAGQPRLDLSQGDFDYAAAMEALKAAGFRGPWVFEGYQEGNLELEEMEAALRRSVDWARRHLDR